MRYLIDTHVLIWALTDRKRLVPKTIEVLEDAGNECFVSAVSLWEMAIKIRAGRLEPIGQFDDPILHINNLGFQTIPLLPEEAASSKKLTEDTHFDPFDRMLIWQAIQRKITLISADSAFQKFIPYGLDLLWD